MTSDYDTRAEARSRAPSSTGAKTSSFNDGSDSSRPHPVPAAAGHTAAGRTMAAGAARRCLVARPSHAARLRHLSSPLRSAAADGGLRSRFFSSEGAGADHSEEVQQHFAGRSALGRPSPTTLSVNGVHHVRHAAVDANTPGAMAAPRDGSWLFSRPSLRGAEAERGRQEETMVVGAACSAVLTGENLHRVLQPGFELESVSLPIPFPIPTPPPLTP